MKSKGACRYSDGSFDAFASTQVTNHDECKDFCNTKSKCDAFDTDGYDCFLFQHKEGKTHVGTGEGPKFCYIRKGADNDIGEGTARNNDIDDIAASKSADSGDFTSSLSVPIIVVVVIVVAAAVVVSVLVLKKKQQSHSRMHNAHDPNHNIEMAVRSDLGLGNDAVPVALPASNHMMNAIPLDETDAYKGIMAKEEGEGNGVDGQQFFV